MPLNATCAPYRILTKAPQLSDLIMPQPCLSLPSLLPSLLLLCSHHSCFSVCPLSYESQPVLPSHIPYSTFAYLIHLQAALPSSCSTQHDFLFFISHPLGDMRKNTCVHAVDACKHASLYTSPYCFCCCFAALQNLIGKMLWLRGTQICGSSLYYNKSWQGMLAYVWSTINPQ